MGYTVVYAKYRSESINIWFVCAKILEEQMRFATISYVLNYYSTANGQAVRYRYRTVSYGTVPYASVLGTDVPYGTVRLNVIELQ